MWALCGAPSLARAQASQPGTSFFAGTVTDAATHQVVPDAYVTITSPKLPADQPALAVTDASGAYRVGSLPPGTYSVRIEKQGYQPYSRPDILVVADAAVTVNAELVPVGLQPEPLPVPPVPRPPGAGPDPDFARGAAVVRPGDRFSLGRSLELVASTAPGARLDPFGLSLPGGSGLENRVLVDGVDVTDPATGALLFPL
ncbi:MAG TPA: carboxypeptidase-like regulatory domain-containing protein, partial [Myxococcales bacterium]|nr:carboxypeptidase-like regulatory domain-containing protein [Myxococcales bacterium]